MTAQQLEDLRLASESETRAIVIAQECGRKPEPPPYDEVGAIMAFEQGELGEAEIIELFQHLLDTGLCWSLQGCYGRTATALLDQGLIVKH